MEAAETQVVATRLLASQRMAVSQEPCRGLANHCVDLHSPHQIWPDALDPEPSFASEGVTRCIKQFADAAEVKATTFSFCKPKLARGCPTAASSIDRNLRAVVVNEVFARDQ